MKLDRLSYTIVLVFLVTTIVASRAETIHCENNSSNCNDGKKFDLGIASPASEKNSENLFSPIILCYKI